MWAAHTTSTVCSERCPLQGLAGSTRGGHSLFLHFLVLAVSSALREATGRADPREEYGHFFLQPSETLSQFFLVLNILNSGPKQI